MSYTRSERSCKARTAPRGGPGPNDAVRGCGARSERCAGDLRAPRAPRHPRPRVAPAPAPSRRLPGKVPGNEERDARWRAGTEPYRRPEGAWRAQRRDPGCPSRPSARAGTSPAPSPQGRAAWASRGGLRGRRLPPQRPPRPAPHGSQLSPGPASPARGALPAPAPPPPSPGRAGGRGLGSARLPPRLAPPYVPAPSCQ